MAGVRHIVAPPPNRRPTNAPPDPSVANEMLVDENQRMADEKRRAKLAQRMQDRSVCGGPLLPMSCMYHPGGIAAMPARDQAAGFGTDLRACRRR